MDFDYPKLILALSSVIVGWALAQFTGVIKEYLHRRKIRKCLLEELTELKSELDRTLMIYMRQLQIHANQGIGNSTPGQLSNHIFKNYYKDALLSLNKSQRISYQTIHTSIDNVNAGILEFKELTGELQKRCLLNGIESITNKDAEHWGSTIKCEIKNVSAAFWHVQFHLNNSKNPDLSPFSKQHEEYAKYLASVDTRIEEIVEAAKGIGIEKFQTSYNPESFRK